jgi:hypothetical protein
VAQSDFIKMLSPSLVKLKKLRSQLNNYLI